jgi:molybdopterin-binding protein
MGRASERERLNEFPCSTDIRVDGLLAQATISAGGQRITYIISADVAREMRPKNGQTVAALIKSTDVMIIRL